MNKRQQRKQFKKKYGMNREEFEQMQIRLFKEAPSMIQDIAKETAQAIKNEINQMTLRIHEAAERIERANEWREIMKNAHYLTDDVDTSLLEHKGTRIDPEGYTYELYRDTANGVYFVKYGVDQE